MHLNVAPLFSTMSIAAVDFQPGKPSASNNNRITLTLPGKMEEIGPCLSYSQQYITHG